MGRKKKDEPLPTGVFARGSKTGKSVVYPKDPGWKDMTYPTRELTFREIMKLAKRNNWKKVKI